MPKRPVFMCLPVEKHSQTLIHTTILCPSTFIPTSASSSSFALLPHTLPSDPHPAIPPRGWSALYAYIEQKGRGRWRGTGHVLPSNWLVLTGSGLVSPPSLEEAPRTNILSGSLFIYVIRVSAYTGGSGPGGMAEGAYQY